MLRSESQKLPALERTGKGEGLMLCPVPTPSVLINKRQAKVANFWRSPYNEVYRIAKTGSPNKPTLPDVSSPSPRQWASPPASSNPLPLPPSNAKEEKNSTPLISIAEERENKGDNPLQIRGILSRTGGENGSDGGKKKPARRVQFADRYEKLCELGRKYGGRAPKAEPAFETCQGEVDDVTLPCTREGLDALQGEAVGREKTDLQEEDGTSDDFHCLSRSSSLPDLVSAPLSGSLSPFKLSPLSNEADSVQQRLAKVESPVKGSRLESPVRIIRNPYSRHALFPSRLIRAKTSMTSQKPYVIYGFDLTGEDEGHPTGRSTSLSTLQRAKTFLSVKGRGGVKAGGPIPRRPLASLCDASKTLQIIQWLRDVNMTQAKEGKCTASLAPASSYDHTS